MRQVLASVLFVVGVCTCSAEAPPAETRVAPTSYVTGPGDELEIRSTKAPEISGTFRVGSDGQISLPLIGRVRAAGLTIEELEKALIDATSQYVREPEISIGLKQMRSRPVSILGAVHRPGVYQLDGRMTLYEVFAMSEGLRPEAGYSIKLTRRLESGVLPLPGAAVDQQHGVSTASIDVKDVLEAKRPEQNIIMYPHDVITVPTAEMIYVIGDVQKAGGFVLRDNERLSALQALSLAEGMLRTAAAGDAKILRSEPGAQAKREIPINFKRILENKDTDVPLQAGDIVFIPRSAAKGALMRTLETSIQMGTGIVIWRR